MRATAGRHGAPNPPSGTPDRPARTVPVLVDLLAPLYVWGFVVLVFAPFGQVLQLPGSVVSILLPAFGLGVLLITPSDRLRRIPVGFGILGLLAWMSVSLLWSENPSHTMFLVRSEILPIVVLAAVVGTLSAGRAIRTLLQIVAFVAVVSLVASLALSSGRSTVLDGVEQLGFRGLFIHKNLLGAFMVLGLCAVLAFLRGRWRVPMVLLCLLLIFGTRSATTAAGLLGVLFVWVWVLAIDRQRTPRERQFLVALSLISVVASLMIALGLLPTLLGLYDKDLTFSGRTSIWAESMVEVGEQPMIGYGFGGVWSDPSTPITAELHHRITFQAAHAHNSVVEVLLGTGMVGLVLAAAVIAQTFGSSLRCLRRPETYAFGIWGMLTLIAQTLMGLAEPLLQGPHLGFLVFVWVVTTRAANAASVPARPTRRATTTF